MRPFGLLMVITFVSLLGAAGTWAADLGAYKWEYRLLLIFAPGPSDQRLATIEKNLIDKSADVQERDLLIFRIFETGPSYVDRRKLSQEDAENLRRRFHAPLSEISLVLIGKDGGLKLAGDEKTSLESIFELIDTMPMRRQEMRQKEVKNDPHG